MPPRLALQQNQKAEAPRAARSPPGQIMPTIHVPHTVWAHLGAVTPLACLSHTLCPPEGNFPLATPCPSSDLQHKPSGEHSNRRVSRGFPSPLYRDALASEKLQPHLPSRGEPASPAQPPQSPPDGWETCPAPKGTPGSSCFVHPEESWQLHQTAATGQTARRCPPIGMEKGTAPRQRDCKRN